MDQPQKYDNIRHNEMTSLNVPMLLFIMIDSVSESFLQTRMAKVHYSSSRLGKDLLIAMPLKISPGIPQLDLCLGPRLVCVFTSLLYLCKFDHILCSDFRRHVSASNYKVINMYICVNISSDVVQMIQNAGQALYH